MMTMECIFRADARALNVCHRAFRKIVENSVAWAGIVIFVHVNDPSVLAFLAQVLVGNVEDLAHGKTLLEEIVYLSAVSRGRSGLHSRASAMALIERETDRGISELRSEFRLPMVESLVGGDAPHEVEARRSVGREHVIRLVDQTRERVLSFSPLVRRRSVSPIP